MFTPFFLENIASLSFQDIAILVWPFDAVKSRDETVSDTESDRENE